MDAFIAGHGEFNAATQLALEKGVQQELLAMLQGVEYIEFDREQPQAALTTLTAHLHSMQLHKNQKHQQDEVLMALALVGLILLFMYFAEGSAPAA